MSENLQNVRGFGVFGVRFEPFLLSFEWRYSERARDAVLWCSFRVCFCSVSSVNIQNVHMMRYLGVLLWFVRYFESASRSVSE